MFDPLALQSKPVEAGVRSYGMMRGLRLQDERQQMAREDRQQARQDHAEDRAVAAEERGMRRKIGDVQLQSAQLQLGREQRQVGREADRERLALYRDAFRQSLTGGGGKVPLLEPGDADLFKRHGFAVGDDGVELTGDEPQRARQLAELSPVWGGLSPEETKATAAGFSDLQTILGKMRDPETAKALGLTPGGKAAITREQAPELFDALDRSIGRQVTRGDGADKRLAGVVVDGERGAVMFDVEATGADGKRYRAPITVARSSRDDDRVKVLPLAGLLGYVDANAKLGQVLAGLGDAQAQTDVATDKARGSAAAELAQLRTQAQGMGGRVAKIKIDAALAKSNPVEALAAYKSGLSMALKLDERDATAGGSSGGLPAEARLIEYYKKFHGMSNEEARKEAKRAKDNPNLWAAKHYQALLKADQDRVAMEGGDPTPVEQIRQQALEEAKFFFGDDGGQEKARGMAPRQAPATAQMAAHAPVTQGVKTESGSPYAGWTRQTARDGQVWLVSPDKSQMVPAE